MFNDNTSALQFNFGLIQGDDAAIRLELADRYANPFSLVGFGLKWIAKTTLSLSDSDDSNIIIPWTENLTGAAGITTLTIPNIVTSSMGLGLWYFKWIIISPIGIVNTPWAGTVTIGYAQNIPTTTGFTVQLNVADMGCRLLVTNTGSPGAQGPANPPYASTTTASFVIPAADSNIAIAVSNITDMVPGMNLAISDGVHYMKGQIVSISGLNVTIMNVEGATSGTMGLAHIYIC